MIELKIGDEVRFGAEWCRNTGNQTGDLPFARGRIEKIKHRLSDGGPLLIIDWSNETIPAAVLACNLEVKRGEYWLCVKDGSHA